MGNNLRISEILNISMQRVKDEIDKIEGISIYDDYSKFPTITKDVIVYAKSDYEDVDNSVTYKSGLYFGELDTLKYIAISSGDSSVADWVCNVSTGALSEGTDLNGLTSMEILKKITRKYVNCNATVTWSQVNTIIEKNTSFNLDISVSGFVNGDNECSKIALYKDSTLVEQLDITDLSTTLSFTTVNNVDTNSKFEVKILDSENVESVISSKEYTFVNPYYVGVSDTDILDETGIKALTKKVEIKGAKTISYTNSQNYMVFAYPSSYGTIKKVVDINGFDVTNSFKLSNVTVNSVSYNVYVSNKVTGSYQMTFSI